MSRSSAHRLRARLAGTPFAGLWDGVLAEYARRLADPFGAPAAPPANASAPAASVPAPPPAGMATPVAGPGRR